MRRAFRVRPAGSSDIAAIVELYLEVAGEVVDREPTFRHMPDAAAVEERYAARIQDPARAVIVAVVEETVAGFADAALLRLADEGTYHAPGSDVHVEELVVTKEHRRRGVGSSLMRAVERWAMEVGARIVVLETHVSNEAAIALYGAIGYRQLGVILVKSM